MHTWRRASTSLCRFVKIVPVGVLCRLFGATHIHLYIYIYVYTHMFVYIYIYTYVYTYTY